MFYLVMNASCVMFQAKVCENHHTNRSHFRLLLFTSFVIAKRVIWLFQVIFWVVAMTI